MRKRAQDVVLALLALGTIFWFTGSDNTPEQRDQSGGIAAGLRPIVHIANRPPLLMSLKERMLAHGVPGVSIAIMRADEIVLRYAEGVVARGGSQPVNTETVFQAASISKPAFATILMRYRDLHGLELDENVNSLLTSWKLPTHEWQGENDVTLRRLLSHTAGTTVHGFPGYASGVDVPSLKQLLNGTPPTNTAPIVVDMQPGTAFRYSGGGTSVAQLVLEDVADTSLTDMAQEYLFEPAGMDHSVFAQPLPMGFEANAALPHDNRGDPVPGGAHTYAALAAAGLWTTPSDILKWASSVRRANAGAQGEIVSPESAQDMLTNPLGPVGIGFFIDDANGALSFGHGGSNEGFRANFYVYTETGDGIAVMTNGENGSILIREIIHRAAEIYGWDDVQPIVKTVIEVPQDTLQTFVGTYQVTEPFEASATISFDGEALVLSSEGYLAGEPFLPEETNKFFSTNGSDLVFEKAGDGTVTGFTYRGFVKATKQSD